MEGGFFTVSHGSGKSDPVPYNADIEKVQAAFAQAFDRSRPKPVPPGVFWSGEEGDEIQRLDAPDDPPYEPLFDGDYAAALVVAYVCDMPFLVYVEPGESGNSWSIHPFRKPSAAVGFANVVMLADASYEGAEPKVLVFDTRNQELIEKTEGWGFSGVRRITDRCRQCYVPREDHGAGDGVESCLGDFGPAT